MSEPLVCVDHVAIVEGSCLVALGWSYHPKRELAEVRVEAAGTKRGKPAPEPSGELLFGSRDDVRAHLNLASPARLGFAYIVPLEPAQSATGQQLLFYFPKAERTLAVAPRDSTVDQVQVFLEWYTEAERAAVLNAIKKRLPSALAPTAKPPTVTSSILGSLERCTNGKCVGWIYEAHSLGGVELWFSERKVATLHPKLERTIRVEGRERSGPFGFEYVIKDPELLGRLASSEPSKLSLRRDGFVLDALVVSAGDPFKGALEKFEHGMLQGWAVSTDNPAQIVEVELLVDGRPALVVRADKSRGDLARRGLSAGFGGFRVPIPFSPSATDGSVLVTAREKESGLRLGKPIPLGSLPLHAPRFRPGPVAAHPRPVTVVVTVYDAADEVQACLESVRRNTRGDVDVVIIDDASPSPETKRVLKPWASEPGFRVLRNFANRGYTASVNRGIKEARSGSDVILLNSDTRVPPRWVQTLRAAAYSGTKVATATAISNNAGAFSVPLSNHHNEPPTGVALETAARRVTQGSAGIYPEVPTGSGFCLYIRRDYLAEAGLFDEAAFPRGYGEENDFCMRGVRSGWTHVVDDRTYVGHTRSASFKESRAQLVAQGRAVVDQRYPEYSGLVRSHFDGADLAFVRLRSGFSLEDGRQLGRPRLLFVISTTTGGTPQTNRDLMEALSSDYDAWLLRCDSKKLFLEHLVDGHMVPVVDHLLAQPITPGQHTSDEYDNVVALWLWRYAIELVHIRHIAWHSLNLPAVAKAQDIPVVFSFHDYYTACPTVKLLDENLKHCGGVCTPWTGTDCSVELWSQNQFPRLKGEPLLAWRARMDKMLSYCDAFITTSESAKQLIERAFPKVAKKGVQIIPHGRDFEEFKQLAVPPVPGEKVRVVIPGNISIAKGALIIKDLIENYSDRYEFHLVGEVAAPLQGLGINHGRYTRSDLPKILEKIRPTLGLILSLWPETYCHTLTELWSCGIPVIAFDMGAVGDRIREGGGGWLVKEMTAEGVVGVMGGRLSPADFAQRSSEIATWQRTDGAQDTASMAQRYLADYLALSRGVL